jgi:hypothetical protein
MNGLTYRAEDNLQGMNTILNKPITGSHPKLEGKGVSVNEALRAFYLGGDVVNKYNNDGVNYVDVEFNKKQMLGNEKYGQYFTDKLTKREPFGVSTGLTLTPVVNGEETYATNQSYDHLAFLHDSEPPAGGNDTVVRFNSDSESDEVMVINIEDMLPEQRLFDRLVTKLSAMFGNDDETRYNHNDGDFITDNSTKTEGEEMTEEQLAAALSKAFAANAADADTKMQVLVDQVSALSVNMDDIKTKMEAKDKAKLTAEEEEKAKLAKAVGNALKVSETFFANSSIEELRTLHAEKCGTIAGNAATGFTGTVNKSDLDDYRPA